MDETDSLSSDIRHLTRELSTYTTDMKQLERTVYRLRIAIEAEDGSGGLKAAVAQVVAQQRIATWYPIMISTLSLIFSVIAILIAVFHI